MWPLPLPAIDLRASYRTAARSTRSKELRLRYLAAEEAVTERSRKFHTAAASASTHALAPSDFDVPDVSGEEMVHLYTKRLTDTDAGREIYDALRASSPNNRCPLCGQRDVSTLDHHLPKAIFAALTVDPANLIPACGKCNFDKSDALATSAHEEPINPYFDDYGNQTWLTAAVIERAPAAVLFEVSPPANWSPVDTARVGHHFKRFGLATLYSSLAANHLTGIRYGLQRLLDAGGPAEVRRRLHEDAISWQHDQPNSWQTAMYTALAASNWYCSGGFVD